MSMLFWWLVFLCPMLSVLVGCLDFMRVLQGGPVVYATAQCIRCYFHFFHLRRMVIHIIVYYIFTFRWFS